MKKYLLVFLALVFFLEALIVPGLTKDLFAATTTEPLAARFDYRLNPSTTNNPTPTMVSERLTGTNAFIDVEFSDGTNVVNNGSYLLTYPFANGRIAEFTIVKSGLTAEVQFKVRDSGGVYENPAGIFQINKPVNERAQFIDAATYIAAESTTDVPRVEYETGGIFPKFVINANSGYSFIYDNKTIHFFWNAALNEINIMDESMELGKIYPLQLYFNSSSMPNPTNPGSYSYATTVNVLTGIDTTKFIVTPKSENRDLSVILTNGLKPAIPEEKNTIEMSVPVPLAWDAATARFVPGDETNDAKGMEVQLHLKPYHEDKNIQVILKDFASTTGITGEIYGTGAGYNNTNVGFVTYDPAAVAPFPSPVRSGDSVVFEIGNLPSGRIYDTTIEITKTQAGQKYAVNNVTVDFGKVYSFLEYDFIIQSAQYSIIIREVYKNVSGTYRLYVRGVLNQEIPSNGTEEALYFTLDTAFGTENLSQYRIEFVPELGYAKDITTVHSQILEYKTSTDDLTIGIAERFSVDGHKFIVSSTDGTRGELSFDISWDIASKRIIDALLAKSGNDEFTISYELYKTLLPEDTGTNRLLTTIYITIKKDPSGNNKYFISYSDSKGLIDPNEEGDYDNTERSVEISSNQPLRARVRLHVDAYSKNALNPNNPTQHKWDENNLQIEDFIYPNIYYLNVKPVYIETTPDTNTPPFSGRIYADPSQYDVLVLDDFGQVKPASPQNLEVYDPVTTSVTDPLTNENTTTETSLKIRWLADGKAITDYFSSKALDKGSEDIKYNLYVATSEDALKTLQKTDQYKDWNDRLAEIAQSGLKVDYNNIIDPNNPQRMYMSDIAGLSIPAGNTPLLALREGKVVAIENIPLTARELDAILNRGDRVYIGADKGNFIIDGLDKNQRYYFAVEAVYSWDEFDSSGTVVPGIPASSELIGIVGELTKNDPSTPQPEDVLPPAPTLNILTVNEAPAGIYWKGIRDEDEESTAVYEYEIIRIKDTTMQLSPDSPYREGFLDATTKIQFARFYADVVNSTKVGLKTKEGRLLEFNGTEFVTPSTPGKFELTITDEGVYELKDNTLAPNQIYFYYVRTERTVIDRNSNEVRLYSTWSDITLTTKPVQHPINLRVERDYETYDAETEIVISFDAPIYDISRLGTDFNLEYSIKKESGEWSAPIVMRADILKRSGMWSESTTLEDYYHFTYIITGLESGTNYSIRVCQYDIQYKERSLYSNVVEARTKMNQEDYNKEIDKNIWLRYLEEELQRLIQNYYWTASDSGIEFAAVYRPTMFDGFMSISIGSQMQLDSKGAGRLVYYLPQSSIKSANDANKGFKLKIGGNEIYISADAFDTEHNQAFIDIAEYIRQAKIKDYYIRITIESVSYNSQIDAASALSPRYNIYYEIVGSTMNTKDFDNSILTMLTEEVAAQISKEKTSDDILKMIEQKTLSEDMVLYVQSIVNSVMSKYVSKINTQLNKSLSSAYSTTIESIANPVILRQLVDSPDIVVKAYELISGAWTLRDTVASGDAYSLYTYKGGSYIFTGGKISIPQLNGLPNSADLAALIVKYGLDDYLGKGDNFDLNAPVTSKMINGVAAKLMGASNTDNVNNYLQNKGYQVNVRNRTADPVSSKQETIYLIIAVYEVKSNTKVAALKINNQTLTAKVTNLDDKYKTYVKAAFQIGICNDKTMDAAAAASVKELLDMLVKLNSKVKL